MSARDPTRRRRTIMGAGVIGTAFVIDLLLQSVIGPRVHRNWLVDVEHVSPAVNGSA